MKCLRRKMREVRTSKVETGNCGDERAEDDKEEIEDVKDEFDVIRILWMSGSSE